MSEQTVQTGTGDVTEGVLAEVIALISDVVGPDYLIGIELGMQTSFSADLELESIEFVALAERLQERYGEQVDFIGWISEMEMEDIIELRVGDLVGYIASCLT